MKLKTLAVLGVALATVLVACVKEHQNTVPKQVLYPIAGKWQETKIVTYLLDTNGAKLYDTTYLKPFTSFDFAQFNNDGTCILSVDHYYYLNEPGMSNPTPVPVITTNFYYRSAGSKFILNPKVNATGPNGFTSADTVSTPDPHTLLIHTVGTTLGQYRYISDAYYTNNNN